MLEIRNLHEDGTLEVVIEKFQPLLRKFEGDDGLVIEEASEEAGSKLGDNYTSCMIRTKIVGKYGNGSPYRKSLMSKVIPLGRIINEFMKIHDLFATEKHVYEKILPLLGNFGPRLVFAGQEEIVMEDLREKGYITCERRDYLDLDHCLFAVKNLATFHGKCLALKLNDPATFKEVVAPVKEIMFTQNGGPAIGKSIDNVVLFAIEHLESIEPRTAEIERVIEYLRTFEGQCFDRITELICKPPEKYFMILHGDPWENNILFKHDENGKVVDVKFVDYQIARHASFAMDFHYFMYTSARDCVIDDHYEEVVEKYYRTFSDTLKECGVSEEHRKNLGTDWFKSELKRFSMYGLFTGLWLIHAVLCDEDNLLDLDKLTEKDIETMDPWGKEVSPVKAERIKSVTLHYMRTYER